MSKTISNQDATSSFGTLVDDVVDGGEEVVMERHGNPRDVLISYDAYQQVKRVREQQRRAAILADIEALEKRISTRNQDLTEEESIALAIEVSDEIIEDIMARDRARTKHDPR